MSFDEPVADQVHNETPDVCGERLLADFRVLHAKPGYDFFLTTAFRWQQPPNPHGYMIEAEIHLSFGGEEDCAFGNFLQNNR